MAKIIDITDKLSFENERSLVIKDQEIKLNADAPTVLKLMAAMSESDGPEQVLNMYRMLFPEESRAVIDDMKLSFEDFKVVVMEAAKLVVGDEGNAGEGETHTTT